MAKTVLALALGSAAAFAPSGAPRATTVVRSDPNIKTDVGSGWKPESGGFSSTDTPDFFYEDDDERVPTQRPFTPSTRLASIARCRGWSLFRFRGRSILTITTT